MQARVPARAIRPEDPLLRGINGKNTVRLLISALYYLRWKGQVPRLSCLLTCPGGDGKCFCDFMLHRAATCRHPAFLRIDYGIRLAEGGSHTGKLRALPGPEGSFEPMRMKP